MRQTATGIEPAQQETAIDHPELDVLPVWPQETIAVLITTDPAPHAIPVSWPAIAVFCLEFDIDVCAGKEDSWRLYRHH
ncbi:hypothetical protein ACFC06_13215 [Nocardia sp. NPDC056064]|uniref:hypothetical protein n=1 Tax=Nocardia sp. NPDC056064 TaxID=3345701 RepID=UPI0035DAB0F7